MHLCLPQSGTKDKIEWLYNTLLSLLSLLLLKLRIIFYNKSDSNTEHYRRHLIFLNKQILSNSVLQNSMQGTIIEFSGSTPGQWTEQTNKMPKVNENLVENKEAPMGHGVKYWED